MANIERFDKALQIAKVVNAMMSEDTSLDEQAVIMILATQALVGMNLTATVCSQIGPKLG